MKKILICTLLALSGLGRIAYAQTSNGARDSSVDSSATNPHRHRAAPAPTGAVPVTVIEYDFDGKQLTLPNPSYKQMKPGDFYQIKVHGVNENLYKILVNTRDTVNSTAIQMPTFSSLDISGITSAIAGINPPSTNIQKTTAPPVARIAGKKINTKTKGDTVDNSIAKNMLGYKRNLTKFLNELTTLQTRFDNWQFNVYGYEIDQSRTHPSLPAPYDYNTALADIKKIKTDITDLQNRIFTSQQQYTDYSGQESISDHISKNDDLKASDKSITDSFARLVGVCSDLQTSIAPDKIKDVLAALVVIQNNAVTDYISLPFQFRNDQAKLVLDLTPKDPNGGLNRYVHEIDFPLMRKAYTGVGMSFFGSTLYNEAFSTVGVATGSETDYTVKPEHYPKEEIGVASLFRFGTKFGSSYDQWGGHFSIGPGISIASTIKPRVLTGAGLTFGGKHMFTIDAGFIAGYVDRLSTAVDLNTTLSAKPDNVVVSQLKGGGFLAIGYMYRFQ